MYAKGVQWQVTEEIGSDSIGDVPGPIIRFDSHLAPTTLGIMRGWQHSGFSGVETGTQLVFWEQAAILVERANGQTSKNGSSPGSGLAKAARCVKLFVVPPLGGFPAVSCFLYFRRSVLKLKTDDSLVVKSGLFFARESRE